MYTIKNKTYAEAGKLLISTKAIGMSLASSFNPYAERDINIESLTIENNVVKFDIFKWTIPNLSIHTNFKKYIIEKVYPYDVQFAIILNKDNSSDDTLRFNKMQEFRQWASILSAKILEVLNNQLILQDNESTEEDTE